MTNRRATSPLQQFTLIVLRSLIGWHFLYEGFYKFRLPGWSAAGIPLASWRSASYLDASTGSLGRFFQWLLNTRWTNELNLAVKISLALVGLSLLLGLFTRLGCWGALALLVLFYCTAAPTTGGLAPGNEGASLSVNKTLIEAAAVGVLLVFNTGAIAGLDSLLWRSRSAKGRLVNREDRQAQM